MRSKTAHSNLAYLEHLLVPRTQHPSQAPSLDWRAGSSQTRQTRQTANLQHQKEPRVSQTSIQRAHASHKRISSTLPFKKNGSAFQLPLPNLPAESAIKHSKVGYCMPSAMIQSNPLVIVPSKTALNKAAFVPKTSAKLIKNPAVRLGAVKALKK